MKKFLLVLILFCLPMVTLGVDNSLQREDENIIHGVINSPIGRLSRHYTSLKLDYISYKLNKGQTVYSQIVDLEKRLSDNSENNNLNIKYLKDLKNLYLFVVSYDDKETMSSAFLQEFNNRRIVINDNEYKLLDEDLKVLLSVVNVYD